jgi:hypothetical protein
MEMMRAPKARIHINLGSCRERLNEERKSPISAEGAILISAVRTPPLIQSFAIWGARKFSLECPQLLNDGGELLADGSQAIFDAHGKARLLGARNQPVGEHSAQALGQDLG